jgi:hypothetical protein
VWIVRNILAAADAMREVYLACAFRAESADPLGRRVSVGSSVVRRAPAGLAAIDLARRLALPIRRGT